MSTRLLANRLWILEDTQALLWDLDGVLIDSLSLDLTICNQLLQPHFGAQITVPKEFIRSIFAYDAEKFWKFILDLVERTYQIPNAQQALAEILPVFKQARCTGKFELQPGIREILEAGRAQSLKMAVVSNNPSEEVVDILKRSQIFDFFDKIVGNEIAQVAKKPAPDTYLLAARLLEVAPQQCVVIEDSLIGLEAGNQAQCYTIGVATGGTDLPILEQMGQARQIYAKFEVPHLTLKFGDVTRKRITTVNDFFSHMIEHIAWRLGVEIELSWYHNDWWTLGEWLGQKIREFPLQQASAIALGMIDDGSAEVLIDLTVPPKVHIESIENVDLSWFLSLRCEQLSSGQPLVTFLEGLGAGLGAYISIKVCGVEDPHHTWEGVFRGIGMSLYQLFAPPVALKFFEGPRYENVSQGELSVLAKSLHYGKVVRGTAESQVMVTVDFSKQLPNQFNFKVASSIDVGEFHLLLEQLAAAAGFSIQVEFNATALSSSHVVCEDTALVLGRALLEILTLRMMHAGVNGAGSSLHTEPAVRVGVSVEGRKFWKWVPFRVSLDQLRKEFIIGQTIYRGLRSEDLDDFLDGLAGGLACSIILHVDEWLSPQEGWPLIFRNLGKALGEVFALNPYRKGVPPGVKATLS